MVENQLNPLNPFEISEITDDDLTSINMDIVNAGNNLPAKFLYACDSTNDNCWRVEKIIEKGNYGKDKNGKDKIIERIKFRREYFYWDQNNKMFKNIKQSKKKGDDKWSDAHWDSKLIYDDWLSSILNYAKNFYSQGNISENNSKETDVIRKIKESIKSDIIWFLRDKIKINDDDHLVICRSLLSPNKIDDKDILKLREMCSDILLPPKTRPSAKSEKSSIKSRGKMAFRRGSAESLSNFECFKNKILKILTSATKNDLARDDINIVITTINLLCYSEEKFDEFQIIGVIPSDYKTKADLEKIKTELEGKLRTDAKNLDKCIELFNDYLKHLDEKKEWNHEANYSDTDVWAQKTGEVHKCLDHLTAANSNPTDKLRWLRGEFEKPETQELLKGHRNPLGWIYDLICIILFPIGIYNKHHYGQFFKPAHGEILISNITKEINELPVAPSA
jgi:hypothetical protein